MSDEIHAAMIDIYCKELKMPGLRRVYAALAREAVNQGHSMTQYLAACLAEEMESRKQSRLQTYTRQARFPAHKTLQEFDFTAIPALSKQRVMRLADGEFIQNKENVICMGPSGTGKTHIAIAIGLAAIAAGYRVRFITVMQLVQELLQAESEYRLPRYLRTWDKYDLVCLDELGYVSLAQGGPLLFQFCADR